MLKRLFKLCQHTPQLKISIEGNIASGKSSIIEYLQKSCSNHELLANSKPNLNIYTEPVDKWRNLNGTNLLELMYNDPSRWAFAFHSYVQLTMLENHMKMNKTYLESNQNSHFNLNIMERSLYSAKYCFLRNIKNANLIKPVEYEILSKWFHWMIKNHDCNLDLIFYLRTSPETCLERLKRRGRHEEMSTISLDYLKNLHDLHESWLCNTSTKVDSLPLKQTKTSLNRLYRPKHVIVIDAECSLDEVCKRIEYETKYAAAAAASLAI